jgi:hypothetical protein
MVAGRRFWGGNEEQRADHQARKGGDLTVKAAPEDGYRSREARGLFTGIKASRQINEENESEAKDAQRQHEPAQAPAPPPPGGGGKGGCEEGDRD